MIHNLKIQKIYFDEVLSKQKTFEIRFNDRNYQVGDTVVLNCIETSERLVATIGYITEFEQKYNYVVFSLLDVQSAIEIDKFQNILNRARQTSKFLFENGSTISANSIDELIIAANKLNEMVNRLNTK